MMSGKIYDLLFFFIKEFFRKSHIEVFRQIAEIIRLDGLQLMRDHRQDLHQDLRRLFLLCEADQKVRSKSSPEQNIPWCAQMTTSYFFHQFRCFTAIALPPGTIHGTTPTPSGNTTGHSVADSHNSLVNTLSSSGSTKVSAMVLVVCALIDHTMSSVGKLFFTS